jgi:hypothetical protein
VDDGDYDGHAQISVHERARRLVSFVELGGSAQPEINWYEHQSRAMRDRHGEGPEPQLRRSYPREHPRVASVDKPEDAEPDKQQTGADLDLLLPFDDYEKQRERKDDHEHRQ